MQHKASAAGLVKHNDGTNQLQLLISSVCLMVYRIAGNFQGSEIRSFVAICESFLRKIWGRGIL